MRAAVILQFSGPEELMLRDVPVPGIDDHEVLMKIEYAGIGQWDIFEREGGMIKCLASGHNFLISWARRVRELYTPKERMWTTSK
jgi:NADPH:quinone reductase-like Zn-dependent oxidoreductase